MNVIMNYYCIVVWDEAMKVWVQYNIILCYTSDNDKNIASILCTVGTTVPTYINIYYNNDIRRR